MKPKIDHAIILAFLLAFIIFAVPACAPLAPGADPLVVRTEQTETTAKSTFDFVLNLDNSNRPFYATNAPPFHALCEWLREPQAIGTNVLPRASALILSVDNIKLAYKSGAATSNDVVTITTTLYSAFTNALQYQNLYTNALPK